MAVMRIQRLGGLHLRRGARLNFFRGIAADIFGILSVEPGRFSGDFALTCFELKLPMMFLSVLIHTPCVR
jgi:hypothetical protein